MKAEATRRPQFLHEVLFFFLLFGFQKKKKSCKLRSTHSEVSLISHSLIALASFLQWLHFLQKYKLQTGKEKNYHKPATKKLFRH